MQVCRICGASDNHPRYVGREMMFGSREEFDYFQCTACGCLQIAEVPGDLGRHYPPDYYSLSERRPRKLPRGWRGLLAKQRYRHAISGRGAMLDAVLSRLVRVRRFVLDDVLPITEVLRLARVKNHSASFLDVGCGSWSTWLADLRAMGFTQLQGADPFIAHDVASGGITILKRSIEELSGSFDLITFHHALEHIADQQSAIAAARKLLKPGGVILVRIPTVSSYAWRHYGTNWVEMDPPRHLYLHSRDSIRRLGEEFGLQNYFTICDSRAFEFYGSEQYIRGVPLMAERSYWISKKSDLFNEEQISKFREKALEVNRNHEGGRACFFFDAGGKPGAAQLRRPTQ